MMQQRLENLLLAIWTGVNIGVGYIAAPVLFVMLNDKMLAGSLAGKMFYIAGIVGLIFGILLILMRFRQEGAVYFRHWRGWLLCLMILFVAIIFFVLQPMIIEVKSLGLVEGSAAAKKFGMLHGISSILFLLTTLFGATLIFMGISKKDSESS